MKQSARSIATLALAAFLPSCATTHMGTPVQLSAVPVKASCSYGSDIRTRTISGIVCNVENLSHQWQDLKVKSVRFPDQTDVRIVPAEDMRALAEAFDLKKSRENYNTSMALSGLIIAGALVAAGAHDTTASRAGEAAVLGGTTVAAGRDLKKNYETVQYGPAVYGPEHLLGGVLRIPSELAIRRQIVIDHPTKQPRSMEICWDTPQGECSQITL